MGMAMEHMAKVIQVVGRVNIRTIRMGTMETGTTLTTETGTILTTETGTTLITATQDMIIRMAQTAITTMATCIRYLNHLHNTVTVIIDKFVEYTKRLFIFYAINAK